MTAAGVDQADQVSAEAEVVGTTGLVVVLALELEDQTFQS